MWECNARHRKLVVLDKKYIYSFATKLVYQILIVVLMIHYSCDRKNSSLDTTRNLFYTHIRKKTQNVLDLTKLQQKESHK